MVDLPSPFCMQCKNSRDEVYNRQVMVPVSCLGWSQSHFSLIGLQKKGPSQPFGIL